MIKFFRKIRKKLADDNKPLKYARYAIGGITLIIIGIILALQLNSWKNNTMVKAESQEPLKRLVVDLEDDLSYFDAQVSEWESREIQIKDTNYINQLIEENQHLMYYQLINRDSIFLNYQKNS